MGIYANEIMTSQWWRGVSSNWIVMRRMWVPSNRLYRGQCAECRSYHDILDGSRHQGDRAMIMNPSEQLKWVWYESE